MITPVSLPTSDNYTVTPTGIEFKTTLSHEDWCDLGRALAPIAKAIGFLVGDWINFGSASYGEKYKEALVSTGIPYKRLANYAYVARKVAPSRRVQCIDFEHHSVVAKLPHQEQKHWLGLTKKHRLSVQRLRKSILLGRLATEEEVRDANSERAQITHLHPISIFLRWWTRETTRTPLKEWDKDWRATIKRDLRSIIEIYDKL
jgi:hypothetical protein